MTNEDDDRHSYPIRAVERVCAILDVLSEAPHGVQLAAIAEATQVPKATVFRYLWSLENHHYVEKDAVHGSYALGPAFRTEHRDAVARLAQCARPVLERLRDLSQETINLGVLDRMEIEHTIVCESMQMMRLAARVGDRGMLHSTALGKAISTLLPEERVRSILRSAGLPRFTDATITDEDVYLRAVADAAERGYAIDDAENQADGRCIAVPIPGLAFGAGISVSAPLSRLPMEQVPAVADELKRAALEISEAMSAWSVA